MSKIIIYPLLFQFKYFLVFTLFIGIRNLDAMTKPATPTALSISDFKIQLFAELSKKTEAHKQYLMLQNLGDRAKAIKISLFHEDSENKQFLDLFPFKQRMAIPQEVLDFDPTAKNTLITTEAYNSHNNAEDLKKLLDIRLYPVLRDLILHNKIEIFLDSKCEMVQYYKSRNMAMLFEFSIPSSATYYLAMSDKKELYVIMAGLVSRENIIAQLITLKLAKIDIHTIEIIGNLSLFSEKVKKDIIQLTQQIPGLNTGKNVLIVAGCGLEKKVNDIIANSFVEQIEAPVHFKGRIITLTYIKLLQPVNGIHGFISLNLNYGEIMEKITKLLLKNCNCTRVFTGGAGGYIPTQASEQRPSIGSYITITQSINEQGQRAKVNDNFYVPLAAQAKSALHVHVASIFLETYSWLEKAKLHGATSVDVETFYIMRAIQKYNEKNPHKKVKAQCGYFVSDYVGEKALREYSNVYLNYTEILSRFVQITLNKK